MLAGFAGRIESTGARVIAAPHSQDHGGCQWPLWADDAKPDHRYCGAPSIIGHSYCIEHARTCFTNAADIIARAQAAA